MRWSNVKIKYHGNEHDGVIKWKHFSRYWPFVRGIHRSPVNSPHKGQWRGVLMFSLICALTKQLSKQSWGWWFETSSRLSWRHCNEFCETFRKNMYSDIEVAPVSVHISAAHVRGEGPKGACRITCQYQRAKANIFGPCRCVAQIPRHLHNNPFFYDAKQ